MLKNKRDSSKKNQQHSYSYDRGFDIIFLLHGQLPTLLLNRILKLLKRTGRALTRPAQVIIQMLPQVFQQSRQLTYQIL